MKNSVRKIRRLDRSGEAGWTVLETLIVLAIVLILTATVGFMGVKNLEKAKLVSARSQVETFSIALQSYYLDCGKYPTAEQGLSALWEKPNTIPEPKGWDGPYLSKRVPLDPWGNEYLYEVPGENGLPFGITSYGADNAEGGEASDADITSW
jgi:general secretion pathway protein G